MRRSKRSLAWLLALTPGLALLPVATASAGAGELLQGQVVHVATENDLPGPGGQNHADHADHDEDGAVETFVRTAANEFKAVTDDRVTDLAAGTEVALRVTDADAERLDVLAVSQVGRSLKDGAVADAGTTHTVRIAMAVPAEVSPDAVPFTAAQAASALSQASAYWSAQTGGKVTFTLANTVTWYQSAYDCANYGSMWSEASFKTGFTGAANENLVVLLPAKAYTTGGCSYGKGMIGSTGPSSYGALYVTDVEPSLWAHELGHNLSLGHANALYNGSASDVAYSDTGKTVQNGGYSGSTWVSYGNVWDVMSYSGATVGRGNVGVAEQYRLGLLPGGIQTVSTSGTYTVQALPGTAGGAVYGLRVPDPVTGTNYFVELRGNSPGDDLVASDWRQPDKGVLITKVDGNDPAGSVVLDGSPTGSTWDFDFNVPAGSTLDSASGKLHFEVLSYDGNSAGVRITVGNPVTVPGAPTTTSVTATSSQSATVDWTAGNAGNGTVTEQTVTPFVNGVAQPALAKVVGANATSTTFSNLVNGTTYTFRVKAKNERGYGAESAASAAVLVAGAPGSVPNLGASLNGATATVTWNVAPDNGAAITTYTVTPRKDGVALTPFTTGGTTATYPVDADADYTFTVVATNSRGTGATATSTVVRYAAPLVVSVPGQVAQPTVNHTGGGATQVSWTAPAANNGTISGYRVAVYRDGLLFDTEPVSGTSTTLALAEDHSYYVTVVATNEQGDSQPSGASGVVDLTSAPDAPAAPTVTLVDRTLTAIWTAPSIHGSAVTGYEVTLRRDGVAVSTVVTSSPSRSFPVEYGRNYSVTVRAGSSKGYSAASVASNTLSPVEPAVDAPVVNAPVVNTPVVNAPVVSAPVTTTPVTPEPQAPQEPVVPVFDPTAPGSRVGGADRYDTASLIARRAWTTARTVIVANAQQNGIDALSASYLAGVEDAPILLTDRDSVPSGTAEAIAALDPEEVIVVGGPSSVSESTYRSLTAGRVARRIAGVDRYDTAALLLAAGLESSTSRPTTAFLARGDVYGAAVAADALAVSPVAFRAGMPVLLTGRDELPASTVEALRTAGITSIEIAGSSAAVSDAVAQQVRTGSAVRSVGRLQGRNRTETAAAIARFAVQADVGFSGGAVGLANGYRIDALAAGPAAGKAGYPLLLTESVDSLGAGTTEYLQERGRALTGATVFGDVGAVSATATSAAAAAVEH